MDRKCFACLEEEVFQVEQGIQAVAEKYSELGFIRISKSIVVNIYRVRKIKADVNMKMQLVLDNGEKVILNRSYKNDFLQLEPLLYGASMEGWNTWQTIVYWIITCISWGLVAAWVLRTGEKKYGLKLFEGSLKTVKLWQWALVAAGAALKIYASVMDWGGFKVYLEWKSYGTLLFIFQYIYYVFETLLFTLILVFAQLAFETWFKNRKIPYGGIVMGLTWGLAHIFTKGSLLIGSEGVAIGLLFGSIYLPLNRNLKGTMVLLFLLFVL